MRKNYTKELKTKIVLGLLCEEETLSQIAGKYEIHPNQLGRWRKTVVEGIPDMLMDKRKRRGMEKREKS